MEYRIEPAKTESGIRPGFYKVAKFDLPHGEMAGKKVFFGYVMGEFMFDKEEAEALVEALEEARNEGIRSAAPLAAHR